MRAVDSNVLVRLVARDDAVQVAAAEALVARGAWVSQLVLVGAVWVLDSVYELNAEQLITAVDMLLEHKDLTIDGADSVRDALQQYRKKSSVSFSDCLVLEAARR